MPGPEETFQGVGPGWANVNNTPFRMHKIWSHEGGIATPLVAHWPDGIRRRGTITNEVGHVLDIMATCLEVTGASYPSEFQGRPILPNEGRSLVPAFKGKSFDDRVLYWDYASKAAVRDGKWKLLAPTTKKMKWELYDMEKDRGELNNLANTYPEKVREMAILYENWMARISSDNSRSEKSLVSTRN